MAAVVPEEMSKHRKLHYVEPAVDGHLKEPGEHRYDGGGAGRDAKASIAHLADPRARRRGLRYSSNVPLGGRWCTPDTRCIPALGCPHSKVCAVALGYRRIRSGRPAGPSNSLPIRKAIRHHSGRRLEGCMCPAARETKQIPLERPEWRP